ncbi:hypothetical protein KDH_40500 [Dictyobacter sp. S3.2.2.5]|uniref:DUF4388 domain-containing protein n=1 Tax=Dictyobacter halimunensis TaxID=3026934 RepID=A0ABQ6FXK0_9CHLR|nr:hypothetical protein KDH_40500 [Dictyobacter sp. S3.2.2.5]
MYRIGLSTLFQVMQEYRQNGRLRAQLPQGTLGLDSSYVFIDMVQGSIVSCYIVNAQGQLLTSGRSALNTVAYVGALDWTVMQEYVQTSPRLPAVRANTTGQLPAIPQYAGGNTGQIPAIPQYAGHNTGPHPAINFIPQRSIPLDSAILTRFPRHLKRVLVLADGTRTVGKIASILSPHEDRIREVLQILHDLEDRGLLSIKRS